MPISRETVIQGFKILLGRDPSDLSDSVSEEGIRQLMLLPSEKALAETIFQSHEFKARKSFDHLLTLKDQMTRPPGASVTRFLYFGNCQSVEIGRLCQLMIPGLQIETYILDGATMGRIEGGHFTESIDKADLIFIHDDVNAPYVDKFQYLFPSKSERIRAIPTIVFKGFQPDNEYVYYGSGHLRSGPVSGYQSALAFWGWKHSLQQDEILNLFREDVYEHLGYLDCFETSRQHLLGRGREIGFPMEDLYQRWLGRGCFMHTINHPKLFVLADIAREILLKEGLQCIPDVEAYLADYLMTHGSWPVYPEIGRKLGVNGSYHFHLPGVHPSLMSLENFVKASLAEYSKYAKEDLDCPLLASEGFQTLGDFLSERPQRFTVGLSENSNPYKGLPDTSFWKRGVASISRGEVDPVISPRFGVGKDDLVATAGSCFAQHIAKRLSGEGFNYYVPEDGASLPAEERTERNYGVFSCRYGNIYTTRQLVQLFDRSMGRFVPKEGGWKRPDGRYVDPFRPQIEPAGFESEEAMLQSRSEHLERVKEMFTKLDILVFTLGLTESWDSMEDGAVFPLAPGVAGGALHPDRHRFHNMTAKEAADDLELFLLKLQAVNSKARVILTVSPVPLIATYENRHVLVSNMHSKSILRTVAGEMASRYPQCDYFPSYEIITGQHAGNDYLEEDLRSVRSEGVNHVMRVFLKHYAGNQYAAQVDHKVIVRAAEQKAAIERINAVICDEEALSN
jgi:hypothetical protein